MMLDKSDLRILSVLLERSAEFSKLEPVDQKMLVWFLTHSTSGRVRSWIDYLGKEYTRLGPTPICALTLYDEIKYLLQE